MLSWLLVRVGWVLVSAWIAAFLRSRYWGIGLTAINERLLLKFTYFCLFTTSEVTPSPQLSLSLCSQGKIKINMGKWIIGWLNHHESFVVGFLMFLIVFNRFWEIRHRGEVKICIRSSVRFWSGYVKGCFCVFVCVLNFDCAALTTACLTLFMEFEGDRQCKQFGNSLWSY